MDTLRQDRKLTEDEQRYAERLVIRYRDEWQNSDVTNLQRDITKYCARKEKDAEFKEENTAQWQEDETEALDNMTRDMDVATMTEEEKGIETQKTLLKVWKKRLGSKYFREALMEFAELKTVKHAKVFQLAFYLFGVRNW